MARKETSKHHPAPPGAVSSNTVRDRNLNYLFQPIIYVVLLFPTLGFAQFPGPKVVATTDHFPPRMISAADFDQDGLEDLLMGSNYDQRIVWYRNLGNGAWSEPLVIDRHFVAMESIIAVDLDQDGWKDVVASSFEELNLVWYRNEGEGRFSSQQLISSSFHFSEEVHAADMDEDGDPDLVVATVKGQDLSVVWFCNDGEGGFSGHEIVIPFGFPNYATVEVGDLDSDGDQDILHYSLRTPGTDITFIRNRGRGLFAEPRPIEASLGINFDFDWGNYPTDIQVEDLNRDSYDDLIALSSLSSASERGSLVWFKNDGKGQFSKALAIFREPLQNYGLKVEDLDQDQNPDLLVQAGFRFPLGHPRRPDGVFWFRNEGQGVFSEQLSIRSYQDGFATSQESSNIETLDVDGDGAPDVVGAYGGKLKWYRNTGSGQFSRSNSVAPSIVIPHSLHHTDLDGED